MKASGWGMVVVLGFVAYCSLAPAKTPQELAALKTKDHCTANSYGRGLATSYSEDAIKEKLKAPATADFGGENARYVNGCEWLVSGYVDAQNSFGAKIRTPWVSSLTFHPERDTYTINANLVQ